MPQSNVIFFYLFAAFFVFITMRGELPKYMGFLLASPKQPDIVRGPDLAAPASSSPFGNISANDVSTVVQSLAAFA